MHKNPETITQTTLHLQSLMVAQTPVSAILLVN